MKKILLLCFIFCAMPVLAETISAVTFNPNRLGAYQYLKVARSAKLYGGLQTPELIVNKNVDKNTSGGGTPSVQMSNQTDDNRYDVEEIDGESKAKVTMLSMIFRGAKTGGETDQVQSIDYFNQTDAYLKPRALQRFEMFGGSATFKDDSWADNVIFEFPDEDRTQLVSHILYGKEVQVDHELSITGKNLQGTNMKLYNNDVTKGFKLAGVDIPYKQNQPTLSNSRCRFEWKQFTTTDHQKHYILVAIGTGC